MTDMRIGELKKEIIIGLIAFLFGGVLTLILENYINRPRPEISVKDISFNNSTNEDLKSTASLMKFDDGLVKFKPTMKYEELLKQEGNLRLYLENSKTLKTNLSAWLNDHYSQTSIDSSLNCITNFPVFEKAEYSKLFLHSIAFIDKNSLPLSSTDLQKMPTVFEIGLDSKKNILTVTTNAGDKTMEHYSPYTSRELYLYNNLIFSFRTNAVRNLFFYVQQCITKLNELITFYQELLVSVENILIENSRIKVKLTIFNMHILICTSQK
jgi:hypothetical protein